MIDLSAFSTIDATLGDTEASLDIDADAKYLSNSMIPATKERMGGVIVGDNIDVDDSGKISVTGAEFLTNTSFLQYFD